jgi:sugar porter (SP) family MFS transporter
MSTLSNNAHARWVLDPGIRHLNFLLLSCYLCAISNGHTSSLISSLLTNPLWHASLSVRQIGLVTSAQSFGAILAFVPAPWVSDTFGRRIGVLCGGFGAIAGIAGQIASPRFAVFVAMRVAMGFCGIVGTISAAALLVEAVHPRQRGVAGALFNTCFFIGSISAAWATYVALQISGAWSWRIPIAVQLLWAVGQLMLIWKCPESPQWLVRNRREEEAKKILEKFHANGYEDDMLVKAEFDKMCAGAAIERQYGKSGWRALYATPGNRKRLILSVVIGVATQWVGNGIITFYLTPVLRTVGITNPFQQQGINGGLQIYNWCLACCAALLSEKAGRRRLFLASASTMLVFMVLVTICSALYATTQSTAAGYAVIVFLFLFFGGYVIGLTPIPILYVNEIWPSHLRTKGTSIFWVCQAVAVCCNQFVNPIALDRITWKYYLVYVGVLVATVVFMFFCVPETKGLSFEEIGKMFDKEQDGEIELTKVVVKDTKLTVLPSKAPTEVGLRGL